METICRLCCSTKFVNNSLFDEENALYIKMELFLPIKVGKGDMLPQKVCNRCSCKVNDLYQFCNVAIEAQDRLRGLMRVDGNLNGSIDLSLTKQEIKSPTTQDTDKAEQGTQTEDLSCVPLISQQCEENIVKDEPKPVSPSLIKKEDGFESDYFNTADNIHSDSSEDVSLISLKKKKKNRKSHSNGEPPAKKAKKKKTKLKHWEMLINALPNSTALSLIDKAEPVTLTDLKQEDCQELDMVKLPIKVKKESCDEDLYQCCICFMQLYSRSDTLQHYRQHVSESESWGEVPAPPPPPPGQDTPRCVRCRKVVAAGEWGAHWARHFERDRRPYRCALCEKTFRDPHQILKHGQTHKPGEGAAAQGALPDKRFICDLCPEGFVYMRYLLAHRSRAHPEAAARALVLRCAVCARSFAHLNSLRRHQRAHSGERNYLCNVCGKALSSREHLKFHIRIHTGFKPHVCKTCGKGFVKKCNLTLHERVHSGEKPHVCSHCGKAFSQRSTLVIHERYHSGARPYVCALCGRGFVAKGLLSMHLKTTCI